MGQMAKLPIFVNKRLSNALLSGQYELGSLQRRFTFFDKDDGRIAVSVGFSRGCKSISDSQERTLASLTHEEYTVHTKGGKSKSSITSNGK